MQKITTPNGETLVVLPLADCEKLVARSNVTAADKALAKSEHKRAAMFIQ